MSTLTIVYHSTSHKYKHSCFTNHRNVVVTILKEWVLEPNSEPLGF
jgi:hypothetical protein